MRRGVRHRLFSLLEAAGRRPRSREAARVVNGWAMSLALRTQGGRWRHRATMLLAWTQVPLD